MRAAWIMALGLWAAGSAASETQADRIWRVATSLLRERPLPVPLAAPAQGKRTAISIEARGRPNVLVVPSTVPGFRKPAKATGKGPPVPVKEVPPEQVRSALKAMDDLVGAAESRVGRGEHAPVSEEEMEQWLQELERLSAKEPQDVALRAGLMERVQALRERAGALRAFRSRNYAVQFVVFQESGPNRSVASVGGKLVREGDTFDDGVLVQKIRSGGVTVAYRGLVFDLPLVKVR